MVEALQPVVAWKNNKLKDQYITILDNILINTINAIQQKNKELENQYREFRLINWGDGVELQECSVNHNNKNWNSYINFEKKKTEFEINRNLVLVWFNKLLKSLFTTQHFRMKMFMKFRDILHINGDSLNQCPLPTLTKIVSQFLRIARS